MKNYKMIATTGYRRLNFLPSSPYSFFNVKVAATQRFFRKTHLMANPSGRIIKKPNRLNHHIVYEKIHLIDKIKQMNLEQNDRIFQPDQMNQGKNNLIRVEDQSDRESIRMIETSVDMNLGVNQFCRLFLWHNAAVAF